MQSRSGSSLIASIFESHGFDCCHDDRNNLFGYKHFENVAVKRWIHDHRQAMNYRPGEFVRPVPGVEQCIPPDGAVKIGVEFYPCFRHLNMRVFTVRRHPESICKSLLKKRGGDPERIRALIARREQLLDAARDESAGVDVDVDALIAGDFRNLRAAFSHHRMDFNATEAGKRIDPRKWHENENDHQKTPSVVLARI